MNQQPIFTDQELHWAYRFFYGEAEATLRAGEMSMLLEDLFVRELPRPKRGDGVRFVPLPTISFVGDPDDPELVDLLSVLSLHSSDVAARVQRFRERLAYAEEESPEEWETRRARWRARLGIDEGGARGEPPSGSVNQ